MNGLWLMSRDSSNGGVKVEWFEDFYTLCLRLNSMFIELGKTSPRVERILREHVARNFRRTTTYLNLMQPFPFANKFELHFFPDDLEFT